MNADQIQAWAQSSKHAAPSGTMTHAEIAHAIRVICEAFGASVPTQYHCAALFVEALAAAEKEKG